MLWEKIYQSRVIGVAESAFENERVCVDGKQMVSMNTNYKIGWCGSIIHVSLFY